MPRTVVTQDVFRAVADPTRRRILDLLLDGPQGFAAIAARFDLTKGAVSQHLSILAEVGLIAVDPENRDHRYRLVPAGMREIDEWLAPHRAAWAASLDRLGWVLKRL